ncbi:MAG TPA: hypothetical protein VKY24_08405 [Reyranella sp.]|jgi:hypothetical protein|nr:hypothetical protein [Reyranella sp.]
MIAILHGFIPLSTMDELDYFETYLRAPSRWQRARVLLNRMMKSNRGRVGMLHSIEPRAFLASDQLHGIAQCPHCGVECAVSEGAVGLLHYQVKDELKYSLVWVCQPLCLLAFEHSQFMGRA